MSGDEDLAIDLDQLGRDPTRFRRRIVELAPAEELALDAAAWQEAIVFLTDGEVELECTHGVCQRFACGAILCLAPPVRLLRNSGDAPARLLAVSRRTPARA